MKTNKIITLIVLLLSFCVFDQLKNKAVDNLRNTAWMVVNDYKAAEDNKSTRTVTEYTMTTKGYVAKEKSEHVNLKLALTQIGNQLIKKVINSKF